MNETEYGSSIDNTFVNEHVNGLETLKESVTAYDWEQLEKSSGLSKERMYELDVLLAKSKSAVFVWSMGLTHHRYGTDNISQVANIVSLRGFNGPDRSGLLPIRGH